MVVTEVDTVDLLTEVPAIVVVLIKCVEKKAPTKSKKKKEKNRVEDRVGGFVNGRHVISIKCL